MQPRYTPLQDWIVERYTCIGHVEEYDVLVRNSRSREEWDVILLDNDRRSTDVRFDLYLSMDAHIRENQKHRANGLWGMIDRAKLVRVLAMVWCFAPRFSKGEQNPVLVRLLTEEVTL
jgi:hypothetical protein